MQNLHNIFFVCLLSLAQVLHASDSNAPPGTSAGPTIVSFIDTVGSHNGMHSSTIPVQDAITFIRSIEEPGSTFGSTTNVKIPFKTIYGSGESRMDISYLFQPLARPEPCENGFVRIYPNVSFLHSVAAGAVPFALATLTGRYFEWSKEKILCTTALLGICTAAYGFYAKRQLVAVSSDKFLYKKKAVERELDYMLREATSLDPQHSTLRWDSTSRPADAATRYPSYPGVETAHGQVFDSRTPESQQHERNSLSHERDRLFKMHADTLDLGKLQEAHRYNQDVAAHLYSLIDSVTTDIPVRVDDKYRFSRMLMPEIEQHARARAAEGEDAYDRGRFEIPMGVPAYPKANSIFVRQFYNFWQRWYEHEKDKNEAKRDNVANGLMWGGVYVTVGALVGLLPKAPTA